MPANASQSRANRADGAKDQPARVAEAAGQAAGTEAAPRGGGVAEPPAREGSGNGRDGDERERSLTITIPVDRAVQVAAAPVAMAGRVLSAKGGLPLYAGLAVLAIADVITWPVAASVGAGYAIMRRWGPFRPAAPAPAPRPNETSGEGNAAAR
jgi:hypothetical protein